MKAWQSHDSIARYAELLQTHELLTESQVVEMQGAVNDLITRVLAAAADHSNAPAVDITDDPVLIGNMMFNYTAIELAESEVDPGIDLSVCSRIRQNGKKSRTSHDEQGKQLSAMRAITLRDGLFESVLHHMLRDDSLIIYGEECREWGGAFGVYRGLADLFPHHRVFNAPISEATIVSSAVGYALEGRRALIELMYADSIGRAGDEIFNQLSKWQAMSGGELTVPVVLRCSVGSKYGAQHSQDWSSLVAHIPGLKVFYPATPYDAKGLMATALSSNDPVVFFESQRLYDVTEPFHEGGVPENYYQIPAGSPDKKRIGDDVTLLTIGPCLYPALEAAEKLQEQHGIGAEVIDARSLVPFDYEPVIESLKKTGRLVIISEACERGSFAATLATNLTRFAFDALKAAPLVLGAPNWIVPGAEMETSYFPQSHDIIDLVTRDFFPQIDAPCEGLRHWDPQAMAKAGL